LSLLIFRGERSSYGKHTRVQSHTHNGFFQTCGSRAADSLIDVFIKYQAKWLAAISSDCLDSRCIACQHAKCLRSAVTCGKTPVTVTLSEPLKILQCFVTQ